MQVVGVIGQVVGLIIVRRPLSLAVVVDDQVTSQSHQPVLQVTLFSVVLFQRSVNPDENFLRQVLGGVCSGGKAIGQVVDSPRVAVDNLLPGRAVPRATPANQFGSFVGSQSSCSPHCCLSAHQFSASRRAQPRTSPQEFHPWQAELRFVERESSDQSLNLLFDFKVRPLASLTWPFKQAKAAALNVRRLELVVARPNILWFQFRASQAVYN